MKKKKKSRDKRILILKQVLQESLKEWKKLSPAQQAWYQNMVPPKPSNEK